MIETVIGLGHAGCQIAMEFSKLHGPIQYKCFLLDSEKYDSELPYHKLPTFDNPELYETKPPSLKRFFSKIKKDEEVLFVLAGSGNVSAAALTILQSLQKAKITILYIKPDLGILSEDSNQFLLQRMTLGVLQEYARSGVFERIYLVANSDVEKIHGGIPIKSYNDTINQTIVGCFNALNILKSTAPVVSYAQKLPIGARISTLGFYSLEQNIEQMFFPLDTVTDADYYYAVTDDKLETDKSLMSDIKEKMLTKKQNNVRVSYGVYGATQEHPHVYCAQHTSIIQKQQKETT